MKQKFETSFGCFSEDGREYIIKNVRTPKPWVNVITNGRYGLVLSQAGGGFSWLIHSEFNRLNRWHQDLIKDDWGKYIYIKNNDTGEFFSPAFLPAKRELDKYKCRHGFGYSVISSEYKGISAELTVFVPNDADCEIWDLKISNNTGKDVNLSVYTYFEWCLGSSADHHREFHKQFITTGFDSGTGILYAVKKLWDIPVGDRGHWNTEYEYTGYLGCSRKPEAFETEKENFVGAYGDLINPAALTGTDLTNSQGSWNDAIGSFKVDVKLTMGGEERLIFTLGLASDRAEGEKNVKRYSDAGHTERALNDVKEKWKGILSSTEIDTPDEGMNLLVNKWLRYQAIAGRLWGRTAYYQQSGAYGFRDQLQDSLVFLHIEPKHTADQILLHAKHQLEDGQVLHWWHPISETGLETRMTDDLLWLPFVTAEYINETDDIELLKTEAEYYRSGLKENIYQHCLRAVDKVFSRMSGRGIPLIGAGDWNDGLSAVGLEMKGESVWLAEFLYHVLNAFIPLCRMMQDEERAAEFERRGEELKQAFNKHAWDGEWFYRATKDSGDKIGSSENKEGRIYLNPQTWSVISGIADKEKQVKAMDAVKQHLLKKNGPLLLVPAYSVPDKYIGYLSRYAPGRRENGGVYTHAAVWSIWAYSLLNDGKTAYDIFKKLAPVYNGMNPEEYSAEPYVTPGNIDGPDSPQYGRAGWTWYTGSAAWFQKIIIDRILGIRVCGEGIIVDPVIPEEWDGFTVKRRFRGSTYTINVINPSHAAKGIKSIEADGVSITGNIIPVREKKEVNVKVVMG